MSPLESVEVPAGFAGRRILILVSGSIAAYKVADLVSQLVSAGAAVRVAMTASARRFVGEATFSGLTGQPVEPGLWKRQGEAHVELGDWAEVILVAPATAHLVARLAHGVADDLVAATVLAARCPVLVAPAMNDSMWSNPVVKDNARRLAERGLRMVEPEPGRLASGHVGSGRLASPDVLIGALDRALVKGLEGLTVIVTAGGTREPIDTVRFIGNYSSGKMGFAMAAAAADRGARVVLVSTVGDPALPGVKVVAVETALQMLDALTDHLADAQVLVMAAAVADFRPQVVQTRKIHRGEDTAPNLALVANPDLLGQLAGQGHLKGLFSIAFGAEDDDLVARGRTKLARKGVDAIVANQVGLPDQGFGSDTNAGFLLFKDGAQIELALASKREMADRIWDEVTPRLTPR